MVVANLVTIPDCVPQFLGMLADTTQDLRFDV